MKKTFKISVVARDAKEEFKEGMGPGVLAYQIVEYDLDEKDYDEPLFANELFNRAHNLMDEMVTWNVEEIEDDDA
jgi:hypothetical protein